MGYVRFIANLGKQLLNCCLNNWILIASSIWKSHGIQYTTIIIMFCQFLFILIHLHGPNLNQDDVEITSRLLVELAIVHQWELKVCLL